MGRPCSVLFCSPPVKHVIENLQATKWNRVKPGRDMFLEKPHKCHLRLTFIMIMRTCFFFFCGFKGCVSVKGLILLTSSNTCFYPLSLILSLHRVYIVLYPQYWWLFIRNITVFIFSESNNIHCKSISSYMIKNIVILDFVSIILEGDLKISWYLLCIMIQRTSSL